MGLGDIVTIDTSQPRDPLVGPYGPHRVDFETYRTIAFEADQMRRLIGFGVAVLDGIEFKGFDYARNPGKLEVGIWLQFVPECYRADVATGCEKIGLEMLRTKIEGRHGERTVALFVERLRRWISTNIDPIR